MLRPLIVIGFLSGATGALADPAPLANDDLKNTVAGSTVEIDTPLGSTVPMRFGADGLVSAEAGVLAPVLGSAKDRGRWWVEGDKLCTKWFRWFDAGVRCLTISRDGDRIFWRKVDDGETGTGTIIAAKDKPAKPVAPTVVAKTDGRAVVAKTEAPKPAAKVDVAVVDTDDTVPVPVKKPHAVEATASVASLPRAETAPEEPSMVASAEVASKSILDADDGPTMRFGGAGLLEASARIDTEVPAPSQVAVDEEGPPVPLEGAKASVSVAPITPAETQPVQAVTPTATVVAPQREASIQAPPVKRVAKDKKKALAAKTSAGAKAVATSSSRTIALYRVTGVREYDVLNVRRGPSDQHVTIAGIPPTGRRVEITGECRESWCPIRYGKVTGWVNSYYLAEEGFRQVSSGEGYAKP